MKDSRIDELHDKLQTLITKTDQQNQQLEYNIQQLKRQN